MPARAWRFESSRPHQEFRRHFVVTKLLLLEGREDSKGRSEREPKAKRERRRTRVCTAFGAAQETSPLVRTSSHARVDLRVRRFDVARFGLSENPRLTPQLRAHFVPRHSCGDPGATLW